MLSEEVEAPYDATNMLQSFKTKISESKESKVESTALILLFDNNVT